MGNVWRVAIGRGGGGQWQSQPAELLFDTAVLASRLREAGVAVESVTLKDDYCLITPAGGRGRAAPEGRRICTVLAQHYPLYRGDRIKWSWDVRQYN
jgi:hypothetical protein